MYQLPSESSLMRHSSTHDWFGKEFTFEEWKLLLLHLLKMRLTLWIWKRETKRELVNVFLPIESVTNGKNVLAIVLRRFVVIYIFLRDSLPVRAKTKRQILSKLKSNFPSRKSKRFFHFGPHHWKHLHHISSLYTFRPVSSGKDLTILVDSSTWWWASYRARRDFSSC